MSRFLSPRLSSFESYTPGEQPRDKAYIKLNTNESPFPPAPAVQQVIDGEAVADLRLYSDPTAKHLREKLAGLYGLAPEQIFVGNGSDDILNFIFWAFGQDGAVFPDISYGFYSVFAQLHGVAYREIPLQADFSLNHRDYLGANALVVIANPNAPTGLSLSLSEIEELLQKNPHHVVVIDEAYVDFGGESCYPLLEQYENLLVVRTFSKSRCMAGARLGYAMGSPALIADLEKLKYATNPYNVNRLTQLLGVATVEAEDYYREKCREIIRVRRWTKGALEAMGFSVLPSDTNFLFAKTQKLGGRQLYEKLKEKGILVRHFDAPRTRAYIRITIGTQEQMAQFMAVTKKILEEAL